MLTALLKCIKRSCHSADCPAAEGEVSAANLTAALQKEWLIQSARCLGQLVEWYGLRDQPDMVQELAETWAEVCRSQAVSGETLALL